MGTDLRHVLALSVDAARMHAGVTRTDLSLRSGIAPGALADLLDGREDFTLVDLLDIATALDIAVTALLPASTTDHS